MKFPKLILFGYGHTVGIEDFDGLRGTRALMPYITENSHGLTAKQLQDAADRLNRHPGRFDAERKTEIGHIPFQRLLCGSLGIRFCIGGAKAAGIEPVWYRPDGAENPSENILQIADREELTCLLHRLKRPFPSVLNCHCSLSAHTGRIRPFQAAF